MVRTPFARWSFSLAVVATLGFGATQALAGPAPASPMRACNAADCMEKCLDLGRPGGTCIADPRVVGGFRCVCALI